MDVRCHLSSWRLDGSDPETAINGEWVLLVLPNLSYKVYNQINSLNKNIHPSHMKILNKWNINLKPEFEAFVHQ